MRIVSADELDRVLGFPALVAVLRRAFQGGYQAPTRHHHHVGAPGCPGAPTS